MKKALITGITGFVGSHLSEHLLDRGFEVHGTYRWRSRMENIEHLLDRVSLVDCDIADPSAMDGVIDSIRPDYVFHLAAQSYVPASWAGPDATLTNNIRGQVNLFESVRRFGVDCRIQIAGSSEEYGLVHPDEIPITEDQPLRPLSPYAVSKVTQDLLGWQYVQSYGLDIIRTRGFNHTGPRRGEVFVTSNFAKQIVEAEMGLREPVIRVGNLDATRDFTDVRDMVRGYLLALEHGVKGEVYNLCSGKDVRIGDILDDLIAMANIEIAIEQDPSRLRPSDVPILCGSAAKFHAITGWEPVIPFEQTLRDTISYWRDRLAQRQGAR